MAKLFYKYSPAILGSVGALIATGFCVLDSYLLSDYPGYVRAAQVTEVILFFMGGMVIGNLLQKLYLLSNTDSLTQLWNRRYFNVRLQKELQHIKKDGGTFCFALIDIDYFKEINDVYGHTAGDELLISLAKLLKQSVGQRAVITRWGGDEFAIIFPNTANQDIERLTEYLKALVYESGPCYDATISVGIITVHDKMERDQIISLADKVLYEDKKKKRMAPLCGTSHA
ncbi:GGDEF domain-containing protein [Propionispora hippei]|uniref:Diguanylate cyclase (GGDEF) domain-containing protein n=1 Tax=Propionispora hippei DSM 15287 TaxID=1123003 RepID=A0A1M6NZA5_9FIRM|nr:GGDEF domain-containing protein [Propionispora hippei]SHK00988.1 diguanylate cyclase (GGDEF) domain-containing protein [Propionispora hippei DSM 15287]